MIESLSLRHFRNIRSADLRFDARSVVICGANGQGKTSLLESLFFLSCLRSYRTRNLNELRQIGSDGFTAKMTVKKQIMTDELCVTEGPDGKRMTVNDVAVNRSSDFIGRVRIMTFLPDDTDVVCGGSAERRRFLDMFISMMDRDYFRALQQYQRALKMRNCLIRDRNSDRNVLRAFHPVMAEHGSLIVGRRYRYAKIFTDFMGNILKEIRPELQDCQMCMKSVREMEDAAFFASRLDLWEDRDREKGYTQCGPQADDFDFRSGGKSLRTYGSRGQCRMISFALKLAGFEILNSGRDPSSETLVIQDDATGDLDDRAKQAFYEKTSRAGQVFHAFTNPDPELLPKDSQIIRISGGEICSAEGLAE